MTVPNGNIVFNSSSGSDVQSSGLGPAAPVYGSAASTVSASAIVTGIDTTGVTTGDLLWVQSSSGRQFSIIASVDSATQVTCDDTFDNTESGRTWAIGGKRATFDNADSRVLFNNDIAGDCVIQTETDQYLTSTITMGNLPVREPIFIRGDATIYANGNFACFQVTGDTSYRIVNFNDLKFVGSAGNTSVAIIGGTIYARNCQFGDPGSSTNFKGGIVSGGYGANSYAYRCSFYGQGENVSGGIGLATGGWPPAVNIINCYIQDYSVAAWGGDSVLNCEKSIISNCANGLGTSRRYVAANKNIFHNITNNAIYDTSGSEAEEHITKVNFLNNFNENIFSNVSGYIRSFRLYSTIPQSYLENVELIPPINYCYNSSGGVENGYSEIVTLTVSPFVDPDNGDFTLNNFVGGGQVLRLLERAI